jgi:hypothetical protein
LWCRASRALYHRGPQDDREPLMIRHFDHVTVAVRDLEAARHFFALLG